jgi:hypothetical protein
MKTAAKDSTAVPVGANGPRLTSAFTLIEVMIALGIFFMAVFAILGVLSSSLHNARLLQDKPVDASPIVAQTWLTNGVVEGSGGGDFGDLYPGYTWTSNAVARDDFPTNGLYQIDFVVRGSPAPGQKPVETKLSILQWNPNPPLLAPK